MVKLLLMSRSNLVTCEHKIPTAPWGISHKQSDHTRSY